MTALPPDLREALETLTLKADLFVMTGFRDEDGVWHDGPHRIEFDAALALIEQRLMEYGRVVEAARRYRRKQANSMVPRSHARMAGAFLDDAFDVLDSLKEKP